MIRYWWILKELYKPKRSTCASTECYWYDTCQDMPKGVFCRPRTASLWSWSRRKLKDWKQHG